MRYLTLNNGVTMPQLGLGVYRVDDAQVADVLRTAVDVGYRAVDTATLYANERGVGEAIRSLELPRDQLFVTTKVWNSDHGYDNTLRAFDTSLRQLRLDYVDLYLIHWPMPAVDRYLETWRALEHLYAQGRTRAIGVSNFESEHLRRLLANAQTVPAVNQIELHPRLQQAALRGFHAEHGIVTQAWRPLARGGIFDHPVIADLAARHRRTAAQIVLRWHLQLGNAVIPKSVHRERLVENIDVFDFELTADDMRRMSELDGEGDTGRIGVHPNNRNEPA